MKTIRKQLLVWLLGGVLLSTLLAAWAVFQFASDAAAQLFDYELTQVAVTLPAAISSQPEPPEDNDPDNDLLIQIWDDNGHLVYPLRPSTILPQPTRPGFDTVTSRHVEWRVYSVQQPRRLIQIAQPTDARVRLAAALATRSMAPFLALIPILALLIWLSVGRALHPLQRIALALGRRSPLALQPVSTEAQPGEVRPLLDALNSLLLQLDQALAAQRNFVADAAHELRTPLTALKLQLQLAERAPDGAARTAAFVKVHERLDRSTRLVQQLLTLARHEPHADTQAMIQTDLRQIAQQAVGERSQLALHHGIDLSLSSDGVAVPVKGHPESLRIMIGNLLDNALRHAPGQGRVTVTVGTHEQHAVLSVADNGPGIPRDDRERVFDRFYRREGSAGSGSGLGLAIVKAIAEQHHCTIRLSDRLDGSGLLVTIRFPVLDPAPTDNTAAQE